MWQTDRVSDARNKRGLHTRPISSAVNPSMTDDSNAPKNLKIQDRVSRSPTNTCSLNLQSAPEKCRNYPKKTYPPSRPPSFHRRSKSISFHPFSKLLHVHTLSDTRSVVGLPCQNRCKSNRCLNVGDFEEPGDSRSQDRSSNYHGCRRTSGKILQMEEKKLGQRRSLER
jgi:hypothetical protein